MNDNDPNQKQARIYELNNLPDDLHEIWELSTPVDQVSPVSEQETELALQNVQQKLGMSDDQQTRSLFTWKYLSIAATLLIGACITILALYTTTYHAPAGKSLLVNLPDGSLATLNGNTSISHSLLFGITNRDVKINGEAYFEVMSSSEPFTVTGSDISTTVLGTKFNVVDWKSSDLVTPEVFVTEGRVAVDASFGQEVILTQDQSAIFNSQKQLLKSILSEGTTHPAAWLDGELHFNNVTLDVLFERLSLHYDQNIELRDSSLSTERLQAHYRMSKPLNEILSDIAQVKDLRIEKTHNGFRIYE